jgi:hypothetical protein
VSIRLMHCIAPVPVPFHAPCIHLPANILHTPFCTDASSSIILHALTRTVYVIFPHPRVLTGAGWSQIIDPVTFIPFWYNDDTGEANYATPKIVEERCECSLLCQRLLGHLLKCVMFLSSSNIGTSALPPLAANPLFISSPRLFLSPLSLSSFYFPSLPLLLFSSIPLPPLPLRETLETALERGFVAIPMGVMVCVLSFLPTYPDRMNASSKCSASQHRTAHYSS